MHNHSLPLCLLLSVECSLDIFTNIKKNRKKAQFYHYENCIKMIFYEKFDSIFLAWKATPSVM